MGASKRAEKETLTVKVSEDIRKKLYKFCNSHQLSLGKFVEKSVLETMEEYDDILWAMESLSERINEPSVPYQEVFRSIKKKKK